MLQRLSILLLSVVLTGILSCKKSNEIPDGRETVLLNTFQIKIYGYSGTTSDQTIDISLLDDYNEFKDIVDGYEIKRITYQLKNDNVPADMYFSGDIICKNEDGKQPVVVASIPRVNISMAASSKNEVELTLKGNTFNKVLEWLEDTGIFRLSSSYDLTNESNKHYIITPSISGSNFEVVIRFYINVMTGT